MALKFTNNATSTLLASINVAATTLTVQTAAAGKFPVLEEDDWFPVTVVDGAGNMEIMRATARTGPTLTVVRAQEGTAALNWSAGARVDVRLTAAALADKVGQEQLTAAGVDGKLAKAANLADLADAAAARSNLGLAKNTISSAAPSGGVDGDTWDQVDP